MVRTLQDRTFGIEKLKQHAQASYYSTLAHGAPFVFTNGIKTMCSKVGTIGKEDTYYVVWKD